MQQEQFKYFAFISYSSKDTEWGKRVQRKLEHYRMPATLCSERGWKRRPINPVFFAPTDIQPGGLTEELQERLRASRNLIVICSPQSARSEWVGKEIEFFHQLARTKQIHFFIVEGQPHSDNPETECFNPIVDTLGLPEILGANIHEKIYRWPWLNRERAYAQLVSKLLGVEFDTIWQRHRRLMVQKIVGWTVGLIIVLMAFLGVWRASQPFNTEVRLSEASVHNPHLPLLKEAVIILMLDDEIKTDTVKAMDGIITFRNIPRRYLNKEVCVKAAFKDLSFNDSFLPIDTTLVLTKSVVLHLYRDSAIYGNINIRLWDSEKEEFVSNQAVEVSGRLVTSDAEGRVILFVPLKDQRPRYPMKSSLPFVEDSISMPCGEDDVIQFR